MATDTSLRDAAAAGASAPRPPQPSTASDLLLDALATSIIDGYVAGAAGLRQAVTAFRGPAVSLEEELRWLWPAAHVAMSLWDDESYEALAGRHIELARQSGLLAVLPTALTTRIVAHTFAGDLGMADELTHELQTLADTMGMPMPAYGPLFVAAWRGDEAAARAALGTAVPDATARGEGAIIAFADYARAVICNAAGRYSEAVVAATTTDNFAVEGIVIHTQGLAELIEGAARSGAAEQGAAALERLTEMTHASGTEWAAGIQARSHALLSGDDTAEELYQEAIDRLGHTGYGHSWPAPTWSTENGCGGRTAGLMPGLSFGPPMTCWRRWECKASQNEPGGSYWLPAWRWTRAPPLPAPTSPLRKLRSHGWPWPGTPMPRSAPSSSSAPARSNGISARSSPNWGCLPAGSYPGCSAICLSETSPLDRRCRRTLTCFYPQDSGPASEP